MAGLNSFDDIAKANVNGYKVNNRRTNNDPSVGVIGINDTDKGQIVEASRIDNGHTLAGTGPYQKATENINYCVK